MEEGLVACLTQLEQMSSTAKEGPYAAGSTVES